MPLRQRNERVKWTPCVVCKGQGGHFIRLPDGRMVHASCRTYNGAVEKAA